MQGCPLHRIRRQCAALAAALIWATLPLARAQEPLDLAQMLGGLAGGPPDDSRAGAARGPPSQRSVCEKDDKIAVPKLVSKIRKGVLIANGCGPQGMPIKEPYGLWRCCNRHDVCYSSCGASFDFCERKFKQCTQKRCKLPVNSGNENECQEKAESMIALTGMFGKAFHSKTAESVCECVDTESEAKAKWRAWVVDVLARFGNKTLAEDDALIDGMLDKHHKKEGVLVYDLITKYGSSPGFVQFNDIPASFDVEGPSEGIAVGGNIAKGEL